MRHMIIIYASPSSIFLLHFSKNIKRVTQYLQLTTSSVLSYLNLSIKCRLHKRLYSVFRLNIKSEK
ncbi:hypothetical protein C1646_687728 [Rhizophagus diaphanus]|nr:hypothetical protein C1646_687728 [Rhizophagus diaphanus] [Rhizophagus sp. MUCL 43196]